MHQIRGLLVFEFDFDIDFKEIPMLEITVYRRLLKMFNLCDGSPITFGASG